MTTKLRANGKEAQEGPNRKESQIHKITDIPSLLLEGEAGAIVSELKTERVIEAARHPGTPGLRQAKKRKEHSRVFAAHTNKRPAFAPC